jgi:hypothetical protein
MRDATGSKCCSGTAAGFGFAPTRTLHTAHIGCFSKLLYPYHPLFGKELEVFGAAGGKRDLVYVRLPNRTTRGIPGWMFDEVVCASVRSAERPMVDGRALLRLAHLLDSAWPASRSAKRELPVTSPPPSTAASYPPSAPSFGSGTSPGAPPQRPTAQVLAVAAGAAPGARAASKAPKRRRR